MSSAPPKKQKPRPQSSAGSQGWHLGQNGLEVSKGTLSGEHHFWGFMRTTLEVAPTLRRKKQKRRKNMGSASCEAFTGGFRLASKRSPKRHSTKRPGHPKSFPTSGWPRGMKHPRVQLELNGTSTKPNRCQSLERQAVLEDEACRPRSLTSVNSRAQFARAGTGF